jgi:hypothetical protein
MAIGIIKGLSMLLGAVILILTVPKFFNPPAPGLPRGSRLAGIAFEMALRRDEAKTLVGVQKGAEAVRKNSRLDDFVIVPLYVALFVALGLWATGRGFPLAAAVGAAVIALAILAGIADWTENHRTRVLLSELERGEIDETAMAAMRHAAIAKWALIAAVMALLATPFLWGRRNLALGLLYLLCALVYAAGLLSHRSGGRPLVEWGFCLMGLAWLATSEALHDPT